MTWSGCSTRPAGSRTTRPALSTTPAGRAGADVRQDAAVGAQPGRLHRPDGDRRCAVLEADAHRTRLRARGFAVARSAEADAVGVLGEPVHHRAGRRGLSPGARADPGAPPPSVAAYGSYGVTNNPTGLAVGVFTLTIADPPACRVGSCRRRSGVRRPTSGEADTPDNLYCKLPQDSPISVRGARNHPCMGKPGKRAPTVEICNSDKEYAPLAERQHALGPYPMDPESAVAASAAR